MKIYTRKGDDGSTGLFGGRTVSKADPRVEAYGLVDEVNAVLGWVRAAAVPRDLDAALARIQGTCFRLGAWVAAVSGVDPRVPAVSAEDVEALERGIDDLDEELEPLRNFVLPGGGEVGARLHVARTVARRAERAVAALALREEVAPSALSWLNRLSDWLFVAARVANAREGLSEAAWPPE